LVSKFGTANILTLRRSSIIGVEKRLEKLLTELRAGLRKGSVISKFISSLEVDLELEESPVWDKLQRELKDVGISANAIDEHKDFITQWLKSALHNGMVDELDTLSDTSSDSGYGGTSPYINSVAKPSTAIKMIWKIFIKDTAIVDAASNRDINSVKKLLGRGANVNSRDKWGVSPSTSPCHYIRLSNNHFSGPL
jgi:hypothetical protein